MQAIKKKLNIWNRWTTHLLVFVLGAGGSALAMEYSVQAGPAELVPREIVEIPPAQGTWCSPPYSLSIATKLRHNLLKEVKRTGQKQVDSTIMARVVKQLDAEDPSNLNQLTVLNLRKGRYEVLVSSDFEQMTLATNEGTYYLHPIPERFHEKYDSLVAARFSAEE